MPILPGWYNFFVLKNPAIKIPGLLLIAIGFFIIAFATFQSTRLQVVIDWETASEIDTAGFLIYRSFLPDGPFTKLTADMIPASADTLAGGAYTYTDNDIFTSRQVYYQLVEVETSGKENLLGETTVTPRRTGLIEAISGIVVITVGILVLKLPFHKR